MELNNIAEYLSNTIQDVLDEIGYHITDVGDLPRLPSVSLLLHVHETDGTFIQEPFDVFINNIKDKLVQHITSGYPKLLSGFSVEGPFQISKDYCRCEIKGSHAAWKIEYQLIGK